METDRGALLPCFYLWNTSRVVKNDFLLRISIVCLQRRWRRRKNPQRIAEDKSAVFSSSPSRFVKTLKMLTTEPFFTTLLRSTYMWVKCYWHLRPHTTSAHVAPYHFCTRPMISVLSLKFEAFRLSLLAFVSQVPVTIRLFLEIHRWPRRLSSLVWASTRRYCFTVLKVDRNTAKKGMLRWSAVLVILVELVSILLWKKRAVSSRAPVYLRHK